MRKFLFALAVVVVTLAFAAPDLAFAATAKYSGTWRLRGITDKEIIAIAQALRVGEADLFSD